MEAMSSTDIPAVGIDLGTTYSAVARLDDLGRPQTLINAEGDKITPSVMREFLADWAKAQQQ